MQQVISPKITGNLLEAALKAWWSGVSIIPIGAAKVPAWHFMPLVWDDAKKKEGPSWKPYQETRATLKEVETWFSPEGLKHGVTGVAAIGGKISSNLLMFDFDRGDEAFDLWYSCVQREIKGARVERTGEGWRVYVRLAAELSIRNAKLAEYVKPDGKNGCIIELKGEGGYALFAPSQYPRLTPSKFGRTNDSYELIEGDWDLPVIDSKTLDYLMLAAREFDELNYDDPRPKRVEPTRPAYTGGGIPNAVVEDASKEINGFLKKCEASDWGGDFLSWGRMAAWAVAIESGLGNPGFVWDAFVSGSKRHPAYDSKHDDSRLEDMKGYTPGFNVSWFAYNLTYNQRHKQCLPKDQRMVLQGEVWQPQQATGNQERAPEDLRRPGEMSLGGQAPTPLKSIDPPKKLKRSLKLSDLRMRPPKEYMDRYPFPKYRKTFVWGASGTGKTLLAVDAMMFAIAEEGANVYCIVPAEECAEEYVYRIDAWLEAYDQYKPDVENRIEFWNDDITLDFRDPNCIKMIMDEIAGKDIDYLLIDTMAALLPGIKDSDNGDFREFFTNIGRLQVGPVPGVKRTVVVLGHANRKGEYKSASAIRDSVDAMFSLVDEGSDKIKLSCEKMRGGGRPKPMLFKRTLSPLGTSAYLQRVGDAEPREYDQSLTVNQFAVLDIFTLEPYSEAISREALEKNLDIKAGPGQRQLSLDIDKLIKVGYIHHLDGDQIRELKKRGIAGNMQITTNGKMAYDAYRKENEQPVWSYSEPLDDSAMAGVGAFLRFRLKVDAEAYEISQDLFEAYQTFCSESDIKYAVLTSISPFVKHLRAMKPGLIVPDRKKDQRIIKGVKIK